jgi:hypothetical protein
MVTSENWICPFQMARIKMKFLRLKNNPTTAKLLEIYKFAKPVDNWTTGS